jgi:hypothetical protein
MVLENVVSAILGKYLGDYILGLKPENLSLGIFSGSCLCSAAAFLILTRLTGELSLENLEVNPNALDGLQIPVRIIKGSLGMSNLFSGS